MVRYAALLFAADENLRERAYWYRCPFPVGVGEQVFAPVGVHDRIQRAEVVRVQPVPPAGVAFFKAVAAKCGAFRRNAGEGTVFETGGLAYDHKHYTRFSRVLFGECGGRAAGLTPLRCDDVLCALTALSARAASEGCVLLTGQRAHVAAAFLMRLAGVREGDVLRRLAMCGYSLPAAEEYDLSEEELARLAGILQ